MKITIIGEIFYDEIYPFKGKKQTGFGGTLYNLIALANIVDSSSKLYLISHLWEKHIPLVKEICKPYPQIDLSGIIPSKNGTATARLTYLNKYQREEKIILYNPSIRFDQVKKFINVDGILINFTALRDIRLTALQKIKQQSTAVILMDMHSLPTDIQKNGIRRPVHFDEWKEWTACANIMQGNLEESANLTGIYPKTNREIQSIHQEILNTGSNIAITTLAFQGAAISRKDKNRIKFLISPTLKVNKILDPTGCGDVFASTFLWKYLCTNDSNESVNYANKLAALNCKLRGLEELTKLPKLLRRTEKMGNTV